MYQAVSTPLSRTSDKMLKQLLSYLLLREKSSWPHYRQIMARNGGGDNAREDDRRRSSGPAGDTDCITVSVSVDERNDSPAGSATLTACLHLVVGEKPTKTKRGVGRVKRCREAPASRSVN